MTIPRGTQLLAQFVGLVAAALFALPSAEASTAQRGAITAPRNLAELVDESGVIISGHVISTRVEPHPQYSALWTVVVTLQVDETLKGSTGDTYTFRQFIWDFRDRSDAAAYRKGGQMLLLLTAPNAQGFSSPSGLEQGRFQVTADASGRILASNGRNNIGLLNGVSAQANAKGIRLQPRAATFVATPTPGPLALDDLRDLIRQLAGTN